MNTFTSWQPPLLWRAALRVSRLLTGLVSKLEVSVAPGHEIGHGVILASNHIGNFDPIALTAACSRLGIAPRYLAMEELFTTPVVGWLLQRAGQIRVDRDKPTAPQAFADARQALAEGAVIIVYPEGRISRDPGLWPERGKTGTGRLALATGAPLIPVAIWGTHEVLPYAAPKGLWPAVFKAMRHRPKVSVRFGAPLQLSDIDPARPGAAQQVTDRLLNAIIDELAPLRAGEPDLPRHVDPTRDVETRRTHPRVAS
ncbi:1-acyl-sn-glycerol-3-phosphate acyltransferase [Rhizocola hellebori]|uniref:1-acyl-sn-glycerol-3-phosphate acyltransferase n=1 Tax=Rhizocola hellebori TaxID=1392758 RepID=A0A8J3VF11_9ACTN|nr:lysophospholipid acyltransferase family protein [Rhizocola hellebori]GIH04105.1 1-acyl-sn-glycerol-3-phosphate acyltransferase [Rhizocola hellebori]